MSFGFPSSGSFTLFLFAWQERVISLMQLYDPTAGKFAVLSADFASSLCYKFRDLILQVS